MSKLRKIGVLGMAFLVVGGMNSLTASKSIGQIASGFGVSAGVSTASDCPSFCTGDFDFDSDGGEYASFADAISTTYGLSKARAYYSGSEAYLPELKAYSSSTAGQGGSASAFGVQGYIYEGAGTETITINFALDANIFDSGTFGSESASASIGVLGLGLQNPNEPIDGPDFYSDFGTWYYENFGMQLGAESLFVDNSTTGGLDTGSISFDVDPGDVFFVGASMRASSRTGTADAFNTFTSTFSNPAIASQLTVANPVAVPEPSRCS